MEHALVVVSPFGGHAVGTRITDAAAIEAIEASGQAFFVRRVPAYEVPPPAPPPDPEPEASPAAPVAPHPQPAAAPPASEGPVEPAPPHPQPAAAEAEAPPHDGTPAEQPKEH